MDSNDLEKKRVFKRNSVALQKHRIAYNLFLVLFFENVSRYLHFNQIETLDPESFQHLPKLERL